SMKNTFSAYVRLSQTRTQETMHAAFHGSRAGPSGPCPGRRCGGSPDRSVRRTVRRGGVGRIIRLQRPQTCNACVTGPAEARAGRAARPRAPVSAVARDKSPLSPANGCDLVEEYGGPRGGPRGADRGGRHG